MQFRLAPPPGYYDPQYEQEAYEALKRAVEANATGDIVYSVITPSNALPCDGAAVNRVTYANLFKIIGETYGAGDGSTTFNVPTVPDSGDASAFIRT